MRVRRACVQVKLIKCLIENIVVDISFNQLSGICTLCFLEVVSGAHDISPVLYTSPLALSGTLVRDFSFPSALGTGSHRLAH